MGETLPVFTVKQHISSGPFANSSRCLSIISPMAILMRKIVGCACAGNAGNIFHLLQRQLLVTDHLGMHHGTCVTHVSWCMSWSLTGISGVCAIRNFTYLVRGPCFRALSTSIISCPSMAVLRLQQVNSSQRNLLSFIRTLKPMTILQILNHFWKRDPWGYNDLVPYHR